MIRVNYYVIKYELQTTFSTEKARGPFGGEDSRLRYSHKFHTGGILTTYPKNTEKYLAITFILLLVTLYFYVLYI